jgi:rubrerythrin
MDSNEMDAGNEMVEFVGPELIRTQEETKEDWTCEECTFINNGGHIGCTVCGEPKEVRLTDCLKLD